MHPDLGRVEPAGTSLGGHWWHLSWLSTFSSWRIALWLRLCPGVYFSESPVRVSTLMQEGLLFAYTYPTDDSLISSFILCFYSVSLSAFVQGLTSAFASPTGLPERGTSVPVPRRAVEGGEPGPGGCGLLPGGPIASWGLSPYGCSHWGLWQHRVHGGVRDWACVARKPKQFGKNAVNRTALNELRHVMWEQLNISYLASIFLNRKQGIPILWLFAIRFYTKIYWGGV